VAAIRRLRSGASVEEPLELPAAQAHLAARRPNGDELALVAPAAHGLAIDTRKPGSLGQREQLGGRSGPRSEGHRA
jgi:hypothetical protein